MHTSDNRNGSSIEPPRLTSQVSHPGNMAVRFTRPPHNSINHLSHWRTLGCFHFPWFYTKRVSSVSNTLSYTFSNTQSQLPRDVLCIPRRTDSDPSAVRLVAVNIANPERNPSGSPDSYRFRTQIPGSSGGIKLERPGSSGRLDETESAARVGEG